MRKAGAFTALAGSSQQDPHLWDARMRPRPGEGTLGAGTCAHAVTCGSRGNICASSAALQTSYSSRAESRTADKRHHESREERGRNSLSSSASSGFSSMPVSLTNLNSFGKSEHAT